MKRATRRFPTFVALALLLAPQSLALAQEATEVEGTADFRNPPILRPGQYRDTIVTGESVWYAILYTNNTPFRFEASLAGVDLDAEDELDLEVRLVGPTLSVLLSGRVVERPGASYNGGTTNIWYLEVALDTEGRLGVEYEMLLDIAGVESSRLGPCDELPDCDANARLADLDQQVADLNVRVAEASSGDALAAIAAEVDELESQIGEAEARTRAAEADEKSAENDARLAEAEIAEICSPEPDCEQAPEPAATTPAAATTLGAVVLLGGLGALGMAARRRS